MTFASEVRQELVNAAPKHPCCAASELNALTQLCAEVRFLGAGHARVVYRTGSATVAKHIFLLLKGRHVKPELHVATQARLGGQKEYALAIAPREGWELLSALHMLLDAGEDSRLRVLPHRALTRKCCRSAFLRGAYLACGTMTSPEKARNLQFTCPQSANAEALKRVLLSGDVREGMLQRRGKTVVYLKDGDEIVTLLGLMGASRSLMRMENIRAQRSLRNAVTRQTNCDASNLEKQLAASREQVKMITALSLSAGLSSLPKELAALARLRLLNPDASLEQLGEMLEPPLGKSGVYHRLKKIRLLAEQIGGSTNDFQND